MKDLIEKNPVIFFLTKAVGFTCMGWLAHIYFIDISKQTIIEESELNKLKLHSKMGKEDLVNKNILLENTLINQQKKIIEYSQLLLKKQVNLNTSMVRINNISIFPENSKILKVGEKIEIKIDYEMEGGIEANIWAIGDHPSTVYTASRPLNGKGTIKRYVTLEKQGVLRDIEVLVKSPSGVIYYKLNQPVNFKFI